MVVGVDGYNGECGGVQLYQEGWLWVRLVGWLVGWFPVVRVQHPPEGRILEMAKDIRFGFGTWSGWW